jgi:hypothetical protein
MRSIGKDLGKVSAGLVILTGCFSPILSFATAPASWEIPFNLPGARTYLNPPAAFDPLIASAGMPGKVGDTVSDPAQRGPAAFVICDTGSAR